ncbi:hypothetical protein HGRIS_007308 [Hohenbuehelia grisea]|uniref:Uncharacterized protein n=1 Tax=Hohenbuehelia grisea TaxID=104357 RepID=A0ABR3J4D4_9AGAR
MLSHRQKMISPGGQARAPRLVQPPNRSGERLRCKAWTPCAMPHHDHGDCIEVRVIQDSQGINMERPF